MGNKLRELKAAALAATQGAWDRGWDNDTGPSDDYFVEWQTAGPARFYEDNSENDADFASKATPETILALLAELEAKDREIDAANARVDVMCAKAMSLTERAESAEKQLATPIKIVDYDEFFICHVSGASDDYCKGWVDGRNAAARDVGKAGFTVEGDE